MSSLLIRVSVRVILFNFFSFIFLFCLLFLLLSFFLFFSFFFSLFFSLQPSLRSDSQEVYNAPLLNTNCPNHYPTTSGLASESICNVSSLEKRVGECQASLKIHIMKNTHYAQYYVFRPADDKIHNQRN